MEYRSTSIQNVYIDNEGNLWYGTEDEDLIDPYETMEQAHNELVSYCKQLDGTVEGD